MRGAVYQPTQSAILAHAEKVEVISRRWRPLWWWVPPLAKLILRGLLSSSQLDCEVFIYPGIKDNLVAVLSE